MPNLLNLDAEQLPDDGGILLRLTLKAKKADIPSAIDSSGGARGCRVVEIRADHADLWTLGEVVEIPRTDEVTGTGGTTFVEWFRTFVPVAQGGLRDSAADDADRYEEHDSADDDEGEVDPTDVLLVGKAKDLKVAIAATEDLDLLRAACDRGTPLKSVAKALRQRIEALEEDLGTTDRGAAESEPTAAEPKVIIETEDGVDGETLYQQILSARTRTGVAIINGLPRDREAVLTRILDYPSPMLRTAAADRIEELTGTRPEPSAAPLPGVGTLRKGQILIHRGKRTPRAYDVEYLGGKRFRLLKVWDAPKEWGLKPGNEYEGASTLLRALLGKGPNEAPTYNLNTFFGLRKRRQQT